MSESGYSWKIVFRFLGLANISKKSLTIAVLALFEEIAF